MLYVRRVLRFTPFLAAELHFGVHGIIERW